MRIGIDFDNTIVCHDALFHQLACADHLIPSHVPPTKSAVRQHLICCGREDAWTDLQGRVYGERILEATPFPGVIAFFRTCRDAQIPICIISHKTRRAIRGNGYDLLDAANGWLENHGFFDGEICLPRELIYFESTKEAKLRRIAECGCTHFIDDLPEFLTAPAFPKDVERILFDVNDTSHDEPSFVRIRSWEEALHLFRLDWTGESQFAPLRQHASPLLSREGIVDDFELQRLPSGANNRVYQVRSSKGRLVLKEFFRDADEVRSRFRAESTFYDWVWDAGVRRTPKPLGWDEQWQLGLIEYVNGRPLVPADVNDDTIGQALEFIIEINSSRPLSQIAIPLAADACFSVAEHLDCVEDRVARLCRIAPETELDLQAAAFVRDEVVPVWQHLRSRVLSMLRTRVSESLSPEERCISPSDFGFHNAIRSGDGRLRFIDFEYAGWDDPAKLICDFFCQPQVPIGKPYWTQFVDSLAHSLRGGRELVVRSELLLPVYQVKWCSIVLNEFVQSERARRDFALGSNVTDDRKRGQLAKARRFLNCVQQASS